MASTVGTQHPMSVNVTNPSTSKVKRRSSRAVPEPLENGPQPSKGTRKAIPSINLSVETSVEHDGKPTVPVAGNRYSSSIQHFPEAREAAKRDNWGTRLKKDLRNRILFVQKIIRHPLFLSFLSMALAGVIVTKLLEIRYPKILESLPGDEISTLRQQLMNVDEHVRKIVPKILFQVELANKQVENLEKKQESLESKVYKAISRVDETVQTLKIRLDKVDPVLQDILLKDDMGPMKKDLEELVLITLKQKESENTQAPITLEDVQLVARKVLEDEIARHAADGIAKPDYALASGGGRILGHSETLMGSRSGWAKAIQTFTGPKLHPHAHKILEPGAGTPGGCLPLKGCSGTVDIGLRTTIHVTEVTLEHVAESVSFDVSSAPKDFRISGWKVPKSGVEFFPELLGDFTFNLKGKPVQTFEVLAENQGVEVNAVRLEVKSNHGSESHTCIYRLRVHGRPVAATEK